MKRMICLTMLHLITMARAEESAYPEAYNIRMVNTPLELVLDDYADKSGTLVECVKGVNVNVNIESETSLTRSEYLQLIETKLAGLNVGLFPIASNRLVATWIDLSKTNNRVQTTRRVTHRRETHASTNTLTGAELEKYLTEYAQELARESQLTAPIPLTKEQDDQLVKEGILPPREDTSSHSSPTNSKNQTP